MKDRINQVRQLLKITQREMATRLGISYKAWQGYEAGDNVPGGNVLQAIAKQGFNINWLLTGEGSIYISAGSEEAQYLNTNLPIQIQPVVDAVVEVMTSDHAGVKLALTQNALMFQEMVRNAIKMEKLEKRVEEIERIDKLRETDFKTQGSQTGDITPGKKQREGGI